MAKTTEWDMKLLIDTRGRRVLFAEANKEVVDHVIAILSLPLGSVTTLLKEKHEMMGCLKNLYKSIEDLDSTYLQPNQLKADILKPRVANLAGTYKNLAPTVYRCNSNSCSGINNVSFDRAATCPQCGGTMNKQATYVCASSKGFVKGEVTYMIMDDLAVKPMSAVSIIDLMNKFNAREVGAVEEKLVKFSIVKMLEAVLVSKTVLTDVFLGDIIKSEKLFQV